MLLQLRYTDKAIHAPCAVFIPGNSPSAWLREIGLIGTDLQQLECYVVPESIRSVRPSGLFVLAKGDITPPPASRLHLYGCIGNKLYVPVNASLFPKVSGEEMSKLLLWELQVFHPHIGLIGFEKTDKINLTGLLQLTQPLTTNWGFAHPGLKPKPPLQVIKVVPLTGKNVIDSIKDTLNTRPLDDIPKTRKEQDAIGKAADNLMRGVLKGVKVIIDLLPEGPPSSSPGLLNHLESWVIRNLDELEKRRNKELNRLLDMFDENIEEALRYAIPLDSRHLNRGTASPSWQLSARNANFNLKGLSGGERVDAWNIGSYYNDLRSKYLLAAQKALKAKDFKKAAYVYAHLLGDHHSAANALEQGKLYREAAALYKDHLKNLLAAAECLERGGLLHEALELYKEMHRYEKAGDLYKAIGQPERAFSWYERVTEIALAGNNYIEAARLANDKLEQPARAKQILLNGWIHGNQPEPCLKRYFELAAGEGEASITHQVQHIYTSYTPGSKKKQYLEALAHINKVQPGEQLQETSRELAYTIISEDALQGKLENLYIIKDFLPSDRLISSDCSRFIHNYRTQPKRSSIASSLQLDKDTRWITAAVHRNQVIAIGVKDSKIQLARSDWYGNMEYYSWPYPIKLNAGEQLHIITDPFHSNRVFVHTTSELVLEEKLFPKNKYFNDTLTAGYPAWLPKNLLGLGFKGNECIIAVTDGPATTNEYSLDGKLLQSTGWKANDGESVTFGHHARFSEVIYRNNLYYLDGNMPLFVSESGEADAINNDSYNELYSLAATDHYTRFCLAIATDRGCLLFHKEKNGLKQTGDFFATDILPASIRFISATQLVVASGNKALLFDVNDAVRPKYEVETKTAIAAILPTADRHQYALLEESGRVMMYRIGEV